MNIFKKIWEIFSPEDEVRYIIGGETHDIDELLREEDAKKIDEIKAIKARVIKVKKSKAEKLVEKAKKNKKIKYIEEDAQGFGFFTPNDPSIQSQWHLTMVKMFEAWDIDVGANGPLIANLDTGVDSDHPDLVGTLTMGADYVTGDGNPEDEHGHGTATAGTTAAIGNNGIGVSGIVQGGKTLVIRVLGADGQGYYSWFSNGIIYAADNGAAIINMSFGGSTSSSTIQNAVNYAIGKGCILIAGAGNAGSTTPMYPAATQGVLAISSVNQGGTRSGFSSYGNHIFVAAPGEGVVTTHMGGGYGGSSGTSFSCPIVSGVAALIWSKYPTLTRGQVIECIRVAANNKGLGFTPELGWGIVDAYAALVYAATIVGNPPSPDTLAPTVPNGLSAAPISYSSFTLRWLPSGDDIGVTGYEVFKDGLSLGTTAGTTIYGVTGLLPNTSYSMTVRARDAAGNWSSQSEALVVATVNGPAPDTTAPTVPTNLVASGITRKGFTLTWNASTDNVGVTGYQVYRNGVAYGSQITTTSLKISGVSQGTTYSMSVNARDAAGNWSAMSAALSVSIPKKGNKP